MDFGVDIMNNEESKFVKNREPPGSRVLAVGMHREENKFVMCDDCGNTFNSKYIAAHRRAVHE